MSDEIDPGIAAILEEAKNSLPESASERYESKILEQSDNEITRQMKAQFDAISSAPTNPANGGIKDVDLTQKCFDPKFYEKPFLDTAATFFDDPSYYKACLSGEGEASQRLHQLLVKYLNCQDKKDKTVYRQQIITAYWEFLRALAPKMVSSKTPMCKRMAMRYGVVLPSLFTPDQKNFFSRVDTVNRSGEPILYVDEWIKEITTGKLKLSTTDEVPNRSKGPQAEQQHLMQLKSKNSGKLQNAESLVNVKEGERKNLELEVQERIQALCEHNQIIGLEPHCAAYTDIQKKLFGEINLRFHALQKIDRELNNYLRELQEAKQIEESLDQKVSDSGITEINVGKEDILSEMGTIRQMAKMTCGRQGNQFPVFTREFFHCIDKDTGFRENVLRELAWIESIDPECFHRIHKGISNRIVPYVLLVPTYGDTGFCWEPFDRFNRITSRGRICIPMYPRSLKIACLTAVADLRWQVAKEKASFDWMTDGLTGRYYQYLEANKMKGDIKQFFIDDYILWMTKEANGTQNLPKEVRDIFWRYMPFPQELKEDLKKRSLVYQELCKKDLNRSMSDGY